MFSAVGTAFASLVLAGYLSIQEESSIDVSVHFYLFVINVRDLCSNVICYIRFFVYFRSTLSVFFCWPTWQSAPWD